MKRRASLSSHNSTPSFFSPRDAVTSRSWFSEMLFNSGRARPYKWEDAERWITSPVTGSVTHMSAGAKQKPQRRPKSKSGPLGSDGAVYHSYSSPTLAMAGARNGENSGGCSPFSAGLMRFAESLTIQYASDSHGVSQLRRSEQSFARSASLPGWLDDLEKPPVSPSLKEDGYAETKLQRGVSRRDRGTQMSPRDSPLYSPPKHRPHVSTSTKSAEALNRSNPKRRSSSDIPKDDQSSNWGSGVSCVSKFERDEAKISAWEESQKAKAETAMRKLEVSLEKKRLASMRRIMERLRAAQKRAQEMRRSVARAEECQSPRASHKAVASVFKNVPVGALRSCFTGHGL